MRDARLARAERGPLGVHEGASAGSPAYTHYRAHFLDGTQTEYPTATTFSMPKLEGALVILKRDDGITVAVLSLHTLKALEACQ